MKKKLADYTHTHTHTHTQTHSHTHTHTHTHKVTYGMEPGTLPKNEKNEIEDNVATNVIASQPPEHRPLLLIKRIGPNKGFPSYQPKCVMQVLFGSQKLDTYSTISWDLGLIAYISKPVFVLKPLLASCFRFIALQTE